MSLAANSEDSILPKSLDLLAHEGAKAKRQNINMIVLKRGFNISSLM
jgi:hypothetical protein